MQQLFFILWLVTLSLLSSCISSNETILQSNDISSWAQIQQIVDPEQQKEIQTQESIQNKIETIRKRLALKWLIIDGDGYYREWQIALALVKYLEFYRKNPEDQLILEKIWNAYFSLNKYGSSYSYYSKIKDPSDDILDKIALSLIHETDLENIVAVKSLQTKLSQILTDWEVQYYYIKSLDCALDFHNCKLDFWEYFWPTQGDLSADEQQKETEFHKLADIKTAIENYRNFQVDQVYLKDAYIVASWYTNEFYSLSAFMWENILSYKPGYKPILKIVAQSYFEMWDYEKAREALGKYQDIDDEDPAVNYLLWIIHSLLRDYILWNIHLSKAIKLNVPDSLAARRQLIHNFYQLDNQSNLLKEFKALIENESNYSPEDLWLAIYSHILEWDYETSLWWAKLWREKFSENAWNFYWYEAWILREQGQSELADSLLKVGNTAFPDNPFIVINLWYTAISLGEKWAAISYFKQVLRDFPNTEFAVSAQQELSNLSKK